MKTPKTGIIFACGALLGLTLALGLGAAEKGKPDAPEIPKKDWARLKVVTYPNGGTGFFDPDTGTLYVYDAAVERCYLIRQLTTLGGPTVSGWR